MEKQKKFSFLKSFSDPLVRSRTLVNLRWLAIFGQLLAVCFSILFLKINLNISLVFFLIFLSFLVNFVAFIIYPKSKFLSELETLFMLLFDLLQLFILLYLTGGLTNPFSILIISPVTISASILTLRSTLLVGIFACFFVTFLMFMYIPLKTEDEKTLMVDPILLYGMWFSLLTTIIFLAAYARKISIEKNKMSQALSVTQMALEREQKLMAIGGVVAATTHELGTPLATIKLASTEILSDKKIKKELRNDVNLIVSQVDRCRDILRDMGKDGKDDMLLKNVPLLSLIKEATHPHQDRGKKVLIRTLDDNGNLKEDIFESSQPSVKRKSEIIHGIRNLVQNAVDYSISKVLIDVKWNDNEITVKVEDDGPGFPNDLIGRIGEPFVNKKSFNNKNSLNYEGMGLGLFIAKTLLERSGAKLFFSNKHNKKGAIIIVRWPSLKIVVDEFEMRKALKDNPNN